MDKLKPEISSIDEISQHIQDGIEELELAAEYLRVIFNNAKEFPCFAEVNEIYAKTIQLNSTLAQLDKYVGLFQKDCNRKIKIA